MTFLVLRDIGAILALKKLWGQGWNFMWVVQSEQCHSLQARTSF